MTIEDIGLDDHGSLGLTEWLQNNEIAEFQKSVEQKILRFLSNPDIKDMLLAQTSRMLATLGRPAEKSAFSLKELIAPLSRLSGCTPISCVSSEKLLNGVCKIEHFVSDHKIEILVGATLLVSGVGLSVATGYTFTVVLGGIAVAGAGSIFTHRDPPKNFIPSVPPPSSKEEIALVKQSSSPTLPKLELPASETDVLVTADGIWANGRFYSNQDLKEPPIFDTEYSQVAPPIASPIPELTESSTASSTNSFVPPSNMTPESNHSVYKGIQEAQPKRSKTFHIEGKKQTNCQIAWINGIDNTFEESKASASYLQTLSEGHTITGIYNCTHGPVIDVLEAAFLNHQGYSPNTAQLLQDEWTKFHEANQDNPNARFLQVCHSQGAIDVKNALIGSPPEVSDRVIVIAIAPAAVVPKRLCFQSYNFASEKDFVYKLEPPPARPIASVTIDDVIIPTFGEAIDDRGELIILNPHPKAEGIDHAFQSPTYRVELEKIIAIYHQYKGEFLADDKDKLK